MALGESRQVLSTTMDFTVAAAAERGGILCAASGSTASYVTDIGAQPSGITPIGILLEDIEDMNFMKHPQYEYRNVMDLGSKVTIAMQGEFYTDFIDGYAKPHIDAGDVAYLTHSGLLTIRALAPGIVGANAGVTTSGIEVGRFMSSIDSNGFAKVWLNIVR